MGGGFEDRCLSTWPSISLLEERGVLTRNVSDAENNPVSLPDAVDRTPLRSPDMQCTVSFPIWAGPWGFYVVFTRSAEKKKERNSVLTTGRGLKSCA